MLMDNSLLEWRLHQAGYTFLTIPKLTLPELERLAIGAKFENDLSDREYKRTNNSLTG